MANQQQVTYLQQRFLHEVRRHEHETTRTIYREVGSPELDQSIYFDERFVKTFPFLQHTLQMIPKDDALLFGVPKKGDTYHNVKKCLTITTIHDALEGLGVINRAYSDVPSRLSSMLMHYFNNSYMSEIDQFMQTFTDLACEVAQVKINRGFTLSGKWPRSLASHDSDQMGMIRSTLNDVKRLAENHEKVVFQRFVYLAPHDLSNHIYKLTTNPLAAVFAYSQPNENGDPSNIPVFAIDLNQCSTLFEGFKGQTKSQMSKAMSQFQRLLIEYTYDLERSVLHEKMKSMNQRLLKNQSTAIRLLNSPFQSFIRRYAPEHAFIWQQFTDYYIEKNLPIPDAAFDVLFRTLQEVGDSHPKTLNSLERAIDEQYEDPLRTFILMALVESYFPYIGDQRRGSVENIYHEPLHNWKDRVTKLQTIMPDVRAGQFDEETAYQRLSSQSASLVDVYNQRESLNEFIKAEYASETALQLAWRWGNITVPVDEPLQEIIAKNNYGLLVSPDAKGNRDPLKLKDYGGYYPLNDFETERNTFVPIIDWRRQIDRERERNGSYRTTYYPYFASGLEVNDVIETQIKSDSKLSEKVEKFSHPLLGQQLVTQKVLLKDVFNPEFALVDGALNKLVGYTSKEFGYGEPIAKANTKKVLARFIGLSHAQTFALMVAETIITTYRSLDEPLLNNKLKQVYEKEERIAKKDSYLRLPNTDMMFREFVNTTLRNMKAFKQSYLKQGKAILESIQATIQSDYPKATIVSYDKDGTQWLELVMPDDDTHE